jgi:hypothetical protein
MAGALIASPLKPWFSSARRRRWEAASDSPRHRFDEAE